ncbi:MAG: hypothetical protein HQ530_01485 [Parcubacteria group bacterium]|nr:hypothetical protein [Parcubacteria group bacterium]
MIFEGWGNPKNKRGDEAGTSEKTIELDLSDEEKARRKFDISRKEAYMAASPEAKAAIREKEAEDKQFAQEAAAREKKPYGSVDRRDSDEEREKPQQNVAETGEKFSPESRARAVKMAKILRKFGKYRNVRPEMYKQFEDSVVRAYSGESGERGDLDEKLDKMTLEISPAEARRFGEWVKKSAVGQGTFPDIRDEQGVVKIKGKKIAAAVNREILRIAQSTIENKLKGKAYSNSDAKKDLKKIARVEEELFGNKGERTYTPAEAEEHIVAAERAIKLGHMSKEDGERQIRRVMEATEIPFELDDPMVLVTYNEAEQKEIAAVEKDMKKGRILPKEAGRLYKEIDKRAMARNKAESEEVELSPDGSENLDHPAAKGIPSLPDDTGEVELGSEELVDLPAGDRSAMRGMPPLPADAGADVTESLRGTKARAEGTDNAIELDEGDMEDVEHVLDEDDLEYVLDEDDVEIMGDLPEARAQLEEDMDAHRITYKEYAQKLLAINKSTTDKLAEEKTKTTVDSPPIPADATGTGISRVSTTEETVAATYKEQVAASTTEELDVADLIEITPAEGTRIEAVLEKVKTGKIEPEEGARLLAEQVEEATKKITLSPREKTQSQQWVTEQAPATKVQQWTAEQAPAPAAEKSATNREQADTSGVDLMDSQEFRDLADRFQEQETTELFDFIDNRRREGEGITQRYSDRAKSRGLSDIKEYGSLFDIDAGTAAKDLPQAEEPEAAPDNTSYELIDRLAAAEDEAQMRAMMDRLIEENGPIVRELDPEVLAKIAETNIDQASAAEVVDEVSELYDPRINGESLRVKIAELNRQFREEGLSREDNLLKKEELFQAIEFSVGINLMEMESEKMMVGRNKRGRYEPLYHSAEDVVKQLAADIEAISTGRETAKKDRIAEARKELGVQPVFVTEAARSQIRREGRHETGPISSAEMERFLELRTEKIEPREIGSHVLSGRISPEAAEQMLALEEGDNEAALAKARRRIEVVKHGEFERAKEAAYVVMEKAGISQADWSELDGDIESTLASIESLEKADSSEEESMFSKIVPLFRKDKTPRKKNAELKAHDAHLARLLLKKSKLEKTFMEKISESTLSENDTKRLAEYGFFRSIKGEDSERLSENLDIIADELKSNVLAVEGVDLAEDSAALDQAMAEIKKSSRVVEDRKKEIQHARNVVKVVDFMESSKSRKYRGIDFSGKEFLRAYRDARSGKNVGKYSTMERQVFESADKIQRRTLDRLFAGGRAPKAEKKAAA